MSAWATRAVLLTAEAYVARGFYREIPALLLRVVSDVRSNGRGGTLSYDWADQSFARTVRVRAHVPQESDLRSAAMLEMAGYAYMRTTPIMVRKHALHLILAGQRYNKAGQVRQRRVDSHIQGHVAHTYHPANIGGRRAQRDRAHHCYITAARVYDQRGWGLAEEHINFTLARQSFHLGRSAQALLYFVRLLNANSRQSVTQQTAYIREMVFIYKVR